MIAGFDRGGKGVEKKNREKGGELNDYRSRWEIEEGILSLESCRLALLCFHLPYGYASFSPASDFGETTLNGCTRAVFYVFCIPSYQKMPQFVNTPC